MYNTSDLVIARSGFKLDHYDAHSFLGQIPTLDCSLSTFLILYSKLNSLHLLKLFIIVSIKHSM